MQLLHKQHEVFISRSQLLWEADINGVLPSEQEKQRLTQLRKLKKSQLCMYACSTQNNTAHKLRYCFPLRLLCLLPHPLLTKLPAAC